ncbi:MAG: META domain-containing protein [Hyphomonadaceae bacterium]|nr:META domain-containing protein [Hyphomonadaceae bacterium]
MKRTSIWIMAAALAGAVAACGERRSELPAELTGRWEVQQIAGASLGEGVRIDIAIDAQSGALTGFTGCNDFSAPMTAFERSITIGAVVEAAGECPNPEAATDKERLLRVLPSVQRYARHGKSLELLGPASGADALLRLRLADAQ